MKNKGYFLVLFTAFISGFSIFMNKFAVAIANPYIFTFLKNSLVALFLTAIIFGAWNFKSFKIIKKKQWLLLLSIGLIGGSVPFLLFFKGLSLTTAAEASFIQKTMFIWIFILAAVYLKEKITKNLLLAGMILMLSNILLLNFSDIRLGWGTFLIFIATLFWALENVISKYALAELPAKTVMWARMFFGSIFILIFLLFTHQITPIAKINSHQLAWIFFTGVLLLGYVSSWYAGLKQIKVSEAAIILMLGSPVTTLLSMAFLKPVAMKEYIALALVILAVAVAFGLEIIKKLKLAYVRS
ncbi:MAG: DMT family transporter [Candidatus Moranbacteria bacterium]|nr:DMT family transporter [Candidatus Moranbacteria bacterium]